MDIADRRRHCRHCATFEQPVFARWYRSGDGCAYASGSQSSSAISLLSETAPCSSRCASGKFLSTSCAISLINPRSFTWLIAYCSVTPRALFARSAHAWQGSAHGRNRARLPADRSRESGTWLRRARDIRPAFALLELGCQRVPLNSNGHQSPSPRPSTGDRRRARRRRLRRASDAHLRFAGALLHRDLARHAADAFQQEYIQHVPMRPFPLLQGLAGTTRRSARCAHVLLLRRERG